MYPAAWAIWLLTIPRSDVEKYTIALGENPLLIDIHCMQLSSKFYKNARETNHDQRKSRA